MASTSTRHCPWSYIAVAIPRDAQPSVSSGTALSPVRGSGVASTDSRKARNPSITSAVELPSGQSPSAAQYAAQRRVACSNPLACPRLISSEVRSGATTPSSTKRPTCSGKRSA